MRRYLTFLFLLFTLSACAAPEKLTPISELPLEQVAARLGLENASWGYHAVEIPTGAAVASHAPDTPQPPASTAKLPTMIAALGLLGPHHRFETSLRTNGVAVDGILKGDLMLHGTGDPMLRTNDLRQLAARMRSLGITQISGKFYFRSTLPTFAVVEEKQPLSAPYNQGISGINLDFNRARLTSLGENAYYLTPNEANGLVPNIPDITPNLVTDVPVSDPALLAARMFRKFAEFEGVTLPAPAIGQHDEQFRAIATVMSLPLSEIVRAGLEYSNNMVSEVVGLAAASTLGDPPKTLKKSADRLTMWLDQNIINGRRFAPNLLNHSGLSAASRISPRQMATLLQSALTRTYGGRRFDTFLTPGGGREGYRGRFRAPGMAYRLWGKTGSMRFIKGLAGYLDTNSGRRLAFAIFTNDLELRQRYVGQAQKDDAKTRQLARDWRARVESFESEIIRRWISAQ